VSKVRVVIENIAPQVDCGRFPAKRAIGETVEVEADVFADGHDSVAVTLLYRHESAAEWQSAPMTALGNDRWRARFLVRNLGRYLYTLTAWVDPMDSWRRGLAKKVEVGQETELDLQQGAALASSIADRAPAPDARRLQEWAHAIADASRDREARTALAQSQGLHELARRYPDPDTLLECDPPLVIRVDRERARYSTWYEMFPRSASTEPGKHGTFADVEKLLPYVASMGFDVLYLPPIHPIGTTERKGPNNRPAAGETDPGSPWAIGSRDGGHKAIHAELGTLEDFRRLLAAAGEVGIEIALDLAFQATPDHPYVTEHPEWFLKRPDGSIQYAENPPKKYQDIYPFHFETENWNTLGNELKSIVDYWIAAGVRIFRVDNPHTKPFAFWEWLIGEVQRIHPDVLFLSEAFTRPKVMYRLAKLGFTQSYNYFPWRNTKRELTEYFRELSRPPVIEFFRANLWPNTPDILTEYLQFGGRAAFMVRLVLAATLGASYGIYGPPFELLESRAREAGSEDYLDSEKYQGRLWDRDRADSLRELIALINRIRRDNAPLQSDRGLKFHDIDNEQLIAYSKSSRLEDGPAASGNASSAAGREHDVSILVVVNLDPHHTQSGWLQLDLATLGLPAEGSFQVHDLLSGARFLWRGARNYVALDPAHSPAHVFRIRRRVRTERDFDYFM
jgi:starch synthase (maltosyl-transferring)